MTKNEDKPIYKILFDYIFIAMVIITVGVCFGFGMYLGVMYAVLFYGGIL